MAEKITMPKLGFDMAEGTLVRWVIQEGGEVNKGDILAEIETDKATVEVESTHSGVLHKHLVKEGDVVPVGDLIAIIGEAGEDIPEELLKEGAGAEQEQTTEAEVEPAEEKTAAVTDKAEPEQPAEEVEGGQLPGGLRASPVARRMAEEHDLDLSKIEGSGPSGRIVKKDVEAYLAKPSKPETPAGEEPAAEAKPTEAKVPAPMPALAPVGPPPPDEEVPLTRLRSIIARRMTEARQSVPHFYVTHEYDMAPLLELRARVNQLLPKEEKISVNDFMVKATALALRQFPNLNATFAEDKIVRHGQVNVGVAVAVPDGLLTVVCRDTDRKPVRQIAVEVASMVNRAREGRVKNEDIQGSTFSVSNMGMFDVDHFIAIINPPEAAILAVGSAKEVPVVVNGELTVGTRMKATLSVDHRVSDGVEAARFMQALADYLEEPMRLLL
jgi:pyruvate dehydrogenase E2 component (dihydrolipoamide acetyltransferase)